MRSWFGRRAASGPDGPVPGADLPLLALDLETTSLDPRTGSIVAAGFVSIDGDRIDLGSARRLVVAAGVDVGHSATIHGLTDDVVAGGIPLGDAVDAIHQALHGRHLLAHHAPIEVGFLTQACKRLGRPAPAYSVIDTMAIAHKILTRGWHAEVPDGALRLWAARERYGLPVYRAHEPLTDALSCAELYLAQVAELAASGRTPSLRDLTR